MSLDYLTYGEQDYFHRLRDYRKAVLEWLKERKLPLRVAFVNTDPVGITLYSATQNKIKGASQGRATKYRTKWTNKKRRR